MTFIVLNPITSETFNFDDVNLANIKVEELKTVVSISEDYRFTITKEIIIGTDTMWSSADLNNDAEDCIYQVFNTFTGQHEEYNSLSSAVSRKEELKLQFINSLTFIREELPLIDDDLTLTDEDIEILKSTTYLEADTDFIKLLEKKV